MLNDIRKTMDHVGVRIILGIVVCAFMWFGVRDILISRTNFDVVTFSNAKSITENDFAQAKAREIAIIQQENKIHLSEDEIKRLNIDQVVLNQLINNTIINYVIQQYDLELDDNEVIQLIRKLPLFKNKHDQFDAAIFHAVLRSMQLNEEEYLIYLKDHLLKQLFFSTLSNALKVPHTMIQNLVNYAAERRDLDVIEVDLNAIPSNAQLPSYTTEQLDQFYQQHQEQFITNELRSFSYIIIPAQFLRQQIQVTDDELQEFYNNNIEEFNNKPLQQIQSQVAHKITQQKADELSYKFNKELIDAVASGSTLKEIADKYQLSLHQLNNLSHNAITNRHDILSQIVDNIFEMTPGETSYPIEIQNQPDTILLVELSGIEPSRLRKFDEIRKDVETLWQKNYWHQFNYANINALSNTYTHDKARSIQTTRNDIKINTNVSITRNNLTHSNNKLPQELLSTALQIKVGSNTPVLTLGSKAYFAHLKSIKVDTAKATNILNLEHDTITRNIQHSILEEMINYYVLENAPQTKEF